MHTDPSIRRITVEIPAECPIRADDLEWAFAGLEPCDPQTGTARSSRITSTDDSRMADRFMRRAHSAASLPSYCRAPRAAASEPTDWPRNPQPKGIGRKRWRLAPSYTRCVTLACGPNQSGFVCGVSRSIIAAYGPSALRKAPGFRSTRCGTSSYASRRRRSSGSTSPRRFRDRYCSDATATRVVGCSTPQPRQRSSTSCSIGSSKTHISVRSGPSRASSAKRGEVRSLMLSGTIPTVVKHGR